MLTVKNQEVPLSTSLVRCLILIVGSLLTVSILSPFVIQFAQKMPFLNDYSFARVFKRLAEILIVVSFVLGWRWVGLRLQFKLLLRGEDLRTKCLQWFALGFLCILMLVLVQYYAGLRILRERTVWFLLGNFFSAVLTAATVGLLEEMLFRGVILQALLQRLRLFWAMFISSFLFSFVHLFTLKPLRKAVADVSFDATSLLSAFASVGKLLALLQSSVAVIPGLFGLFLTGWLLAEVTVRCLSLWPAIGLHAGWVLGIKFLNRIWKFKPGPDAAPLWLFGEKFAATGVLGWGLLLILIYIVRRRLPLKQ